MNLLSTYQNGNCTVSLYDDGTKVREFEDVPLPVYPESIDVKITNYCNAGCAYCHEMSTRSGTHGDLVRGLSIISQLPAGVEIAIGGGNPLDHPELYSFLYVLKELGIVANMTVNQVHLQPHTDLITRLRNESLIHGLGISYRAASPLLHQFVDSNTVFHLILGVHKVEDLQEIQRCSPRAKVLLLGYKQVGRGIGYFSQSVTNEIERWSNQLPQFFGSNITLSFDNLAITQLHVRRFFSEKAWQQFYMGDDGQFTMYMDLVTQTYARSSTSSNKFPVTDSIKDMFAHVRSMEAA